MRPPGAFDLVPFECLGAGPAFGRAQNDHGPLGPFDYLPGRRAAGLFLDGADIQHAAFEDFGHFGVHDVGVIAFHNVGRPSKPPEEHVQFVRRNARKDGGVGNLVAVQVQDRKHGPVAYRVEEFVGVPTRGQRSGLRLAVAYGYGDDEVGIVESRSKTMGKAVPQFAALMNRSWRFGSAMAAYASGEGELLE